MKTISQTLLFSLLTLAFAWFSLFGLVASLESMSMDSHCLFNQNDCHMDLAMHLNLWNFMFQSMLTQNISLNLASFLVVLLATVLMATALTAAVRILTISYYLYKADHPDEATFDVLKLALAQGILNPKIF